MRPLVADLPGNLLAVPADCDQYGGRRLFIAFHCCPAILLMAGGKSLVANRKKDFLGVTDLNLDLGDWGFSALVIPNVRRQTCFRATDGFSSVAHISSLRLALPVELPHKNVLPSGSISVHGLRAIDLPREPA